MNISVLVVVYNEERRLKGCLSSLRRFTDVVVVDLNSQDRSAEIAKEHGCMVIKRSWVPAVEMAIPSLLPMLKNDWVLLVDPDEVLPKKLVDDFFQLELDNKFGVIDIPYQYFFLGKRLDTTVWGGVRFLPRVINRKRVSVTSDVHRAIKCAPGYETFTLPYQLNNAVQHCWIDSYKQLFQKHNRYIIMEGESRYNNGFRFNWGLLVYRPVRSFLSSFIKYGGWHGGWNGWFLSFFYAYYELRACLSLYHFEKKRSS